MPKLIIRHRRRRLVPDLEKEYRKTLGQYMWGALGIMVLLQILCMPPLYLLGPFYWLPAVVFPPLVALGYWMFSQPLTRAVEMAPPKIYFSSIVAVALTFFFAGHYFFNTDYLVKITDSEGKAKTHLAKIGEIVSTVLAAGIEDDEETQEQAIRKPRRLDGDWSDPEFLKEMPELYRSHLSKTIIKHQESDTESKETAFSGEEPESFTTKPPLDGYYYFYACRPTGVWVVWCESAHYPHGGRKLFVLGHKGLMFSRDVKGLHINFKSFPSSLQQSRFQTEGKFKWGAVPIKAVDDEDENEETSEVP